MPGSHVSATPSRSARSDRRAPTPGTAGSRSMKREAPGSAVKIQSFEMKRRDRDVIEEPEEERDIISCCGGCCAWDAVKRPCCCGCCTCRCPDCTCSNFFKGGIAAAVLIGLGVIFIAIWFLVIVKHQNRHNPSVPEEPLTPADILCSDADAQAVLRLNEIYFDSNHRVDGVEFYVTASSICHVNLAGWRISPISDGAFNHHNYYKFPHVDIMPNQYYVWQLDGMFVDENTSGIGLFLPEVGGDEVVFATHWDAPSSILGPQVSWGLVPETKFQDEDKFEPLFPTIGKRNQHLGGRRLGGKPPRA